MYILSQNSAEDVWHSDYFKSSSQPLLQKSPKDKPKQGPVLYKDNHQMSFRKMELGQAGIEWSW